MVLDVIIDGDSTTIQIPDPFHPDLDGLIGQIDRFAFSKGTDTSGLDIRSLIPKMIKGIAGCENGCPANAKSLVSSGVEGFELQYIEGGILSAKTSGRDGSQFCLKMFPDF
ncbi:MAG TPA: hypothetical protein VN328_06575 [Thermodesulfovibrionales bacterium]|nr:hypothetical protein [Thermodesulfovibrionales bacterium]